MDATVPHLPRKQAWYVTVAYYNVEYVTGSPTVNEKLRMICIFQYIQFLFALESTYIPLYTYRRLVPQGQLSADRKRNLFSIYLPLSAPKRSIGCSNLGKRPRHYPQCRYPCQSGSPKKDQKSRSHLIMDEKKRGSERGRGVGFKWVEDEMHTEAGVHVRTLVVPFELHENFVASAKGRSGKRCAVRYPCDHPPHC